MFLEEFNVSLGMINKGEIYEVLYQFSPCCLTHFKLSRAAKLHDPTNMKLV